MESQNLGELKTVSNTLRDHKFEADELVVGWVIVDGDVVPVAFTERELKRPLDRAKDNREDLPTLGAKPLSHERVKDLMERNKKMQEKLHAIRNRGLLDRILNTGWKDEE